jgi:polyhydroxyalkanoate synthesis regulator phasin
MIEAKGIAKQAITFQKALFENTFNAMKMVQEQTEKIMDTFLSQLPWVPEEGKKSISDSVEFYKKAREDFKKAVDEGFAKMEELFIQ